MCESPVPNRSVCSSSAPKDRNSVTPVRSVVASRVVLHPAPKPTSSSTNLISWASASPLPRKVLATPIHAAESPRPPWTEICSKSSITGNSETISMRLCARRTSSHEFGSHQPMAPPIQPTRTAGVSEGSWSNAIQPNINAPDMVSSTCTATNFIC